MGVSGSGVSDKGQHTTKQCLKVGRGGGVGRWGGGGLYTDSKFLMPIPQKLRGKLAGKKQKESEKPNEVVRKGGNLSLKITNFLPVNKREVGQTNGIEIKFKELWKNRIVRTNEPQL